MKKFGNPSKHSLINYSKYLIDVVNSRFPETKLKIKNNHRKKIYSISYYESIVAIKIDSKKSIEASILKNNDNELFKFTDMRTSDYFPKVSGYIKKKFPFLHNIFIIKKIVRYLFYTHNFIIKIKHYFKLKKYFK